MKTSAAGLDLIARFEGLRLTAYKPVAAERWWTIGYGHYGPDVHEGQRITVEQARAFLRQDVAAAEKAVDDGVAVHLNQHQFDALVSFTFNVGAANFRASTLLRVLNAGQYQAAADQLLRWTRAADGKELGGLVARRRAERALFLTRPPDPTLRPGAHGKAVRELQALLDKRGWKIAVDGVYGPSTEHAINVFKRHHGWQEDGVAGPRVWEALRG